MLMTGCGLELPFILGATTIGVGTKVAIDRRDAGAQVDDLAIESKAQSLIAKNFPQAHVNVNSYNRNALLTGEVPTPSVAQSIEQEVRNLSPVRSVFNQTVVRQNSTLSERSHDGWITSKVKANFVADSTINGKDISVVTEAGVVYLMGLLTADEANRARTLVSSDIAGVKKVVSLFEIVQSKPAGN